MDVFGRENPDGVTVRGDMRKRNRVILLLSIVSGLIAGALVLHPVSRILQNIQMEGNLEIVRIISESFTGRHFLMGGYFSLLGGLLGVIVGLLIRNALKKYEASMELYRTLLDSNNRFIARIQEREQDSSNLARAILPSLLKIKKDIEDMQTGNTGMGKDKRIQFAVSQNIESIMFLLITIIENENEADWGETI